MKVDGGELQLICWCQGASAAFHGAGWKRAVPSASIRALSEPHTCEPGKEDAANSQDLGIAFCVAVLPLSTGSFEEGFPMSFNMQLFQGVYHLRRVLLCPEDIPQRDQFTVSKPPLVIFSLNIYLKNAFRFKMLQCWHVGVWFVLPLAVCLNAPHLNKSWDWKALQSCLHQLMTLQHFISCGGCLLTISASSFQEHRQWNFLRGQRGYVFSHAVSPAAVSILHLPVAHLFDEMSLATPLLGLNTPIKTRI